MMKLRIFDIFEWLGRHELEVLVALLIVVAGTWGFIALADVVLAGRTQSFDESILRAPSAGRTTPQYRSVPTGWPRWGAT